MNEHATAPKDKHDDITLRIVTRTQANAWFAFTSAHEAIMDRIEEVLMERHRKSFSTVEILCRLGEREPQPVRALADQLVSVSPTRASRLVQDLIDDGLLERGADQGDGRISLISFTEAGRRYAETVTRTFEQAVETYFVAPLDDDDIAAITRIAGKLHTATTS